MPAPCPCCGGRLFHEIMDAKGVPLTGIYRGSDTESLPRIDLSFVSCSACGLGRQCSSAPHADYAKVDRAPKRRLPDYVEQIILTFSGSGIGPQDLILEVGSNDGAFLGALASRGYRNLVGVEPSRRLSATARDNGLRMESDFFSAGLARGLCDKYGRARAIFCRHTIEHVPNVVDFVAGLRLAAEPDGCLLVLEVPDSSVIAEEMNFFELWDEHIYYFTEGNLNLLAARGGFRVNRIDVVPHMETRNLVLWGEAHPVTASCDAPLSTAQREVGAWARFASDWPAYRSRLWNAIKKAPRPAYLIGAAHLQANFVNFLGPGLDVDFLIDDDPAKVGKFAPVAGSGGKIISTQEFLSGARAGSVVKTGFGYGAWTGRICEHALRAGMTIIDPRSL